MNTRKTYYDLLEVKIGAKPQEIRASYRRLAKKYHPDLNPDNPQAPELFRTLHEAYETLADPARRQAYDATLKKATYVREEVDNPFEDWYGVATAAASASVRETPYRRRYMSRAHKPRHSYSYYSVDLTLTELFKGAKRTITVGQTHTCGRCRGSGVMPNNGQPCQRCGGFGFMVTYETVDVNIPPGMVPEMSIRIEMGHWLEDARHPLHMPFATGIYVTIHLMPHALYRVEGHDLYTTVAVPAEALESGGDWTLPAPEGGELSFKIPANTRSGEVIRLRKHGLLSGASSRRGSLFCTLVAEH